MHHLWILSQIWKNARLIFHINETEGTGGEQFCSEIAESGENKTDIGADGVERRLDTLTGAQGIDTRLLTWPATCCSQTPL
ncbi:MAG: hypothetical protein ABSD44_10435 [Terracidiphilus sp.]